MENCPYWSHYDTPPCEDSLAYSTRYGLARNVHNFVTEREELRWFQRFCEEIRVVVNSRNKRDDKTTLLNKLAHKIVPAVYVFRAGVVLWIVGRINRCLVI